MYKPNCGLENLMISWGHDEYLYRVLVHNHSKFPKEGLFMISKYDLYTKSAGVPDIEALWPYYEQLIEKYIPGVLEW
ncbi:hypothetical protein SFRURICE_000430 [Spodoptera frugiperda]|nr:hypothetical protein SFRURICE_000430 [Spodoptera frugiperda]